MHVTLGMIWTSCVPICVITHFYFLQVLPSLKSLEVVNFGDCLIKTKGAKALAECLRSALNNLKELNLSFDEINKEGALAIVEALASKDTLEKLELNGNYVK